MTVYNSIDKLSKKTIEEIEGLRMAIIEASLSSKEVKINMKNTARDSFNMNSFEKLKNRNMKELEGLYVSIVENSNKEINTILDGIKVIKPMKTHKNKIKVLKKYGNKVKAIKKYSNKVKIMKEYNNKLEY